MMTKPTLRRVRLALTGACLATPVLAVPLMAAEAQDQEQAQDQVGGRNELSASFLPPPPATDFATEFASVLGPLAPASPAETIAIPAHAVDISTFEPPRPPVPSVVRDLGTGVASFYGRRFHGRLTANGERFNMNAMTAAHKTLPFGTRVRVTNARNGRTVVVRINDRGPFVEGRTIDLSRAAARRIGMISKGHAQVKLDIVKKSGN